MGMSMSTAASMAWCCGRDRSGQLTSDQRDRRRAGDQGVASVDPHLAPDRFLCELGGYRAGPLQQTRPICGTAWEPLEVLATLDKHPFTTGEFYDDGGILIAFSFELHERIRCDCTDQIPRLVVAHSVGKASSLQLLLCPLPL